MNTELKQINDKWMIELNPIHKFNGGIGCNLCLTCHTMINVGVSESLFCEECLQKNFISLHNIVDIKNYKNVSNK